MSLGILQGRSPASWTLLNSSSGRRASSRVCTVQAVCTLSILCTGPPQYTQLVVDEQVDHSRPGPGLRVSILVGIGDVVGWRSPHVLSTIVLKRPEYLSIHVQVDLSISATLT